MKGIVNLPAVRQIERFAPKCSAQSQRTHGQLVNAPHARALPMGRTISKWGASRTQANYRKASQAYVKTQRLAYAKRRSIVDFYL